MSCKTLRSLIVLSVLGMGLGPAVCFAGAGDIHPTEIPEGLIAPNELVYVRWLEPVTAILEVGPSAVEWTDTVSTISSTPGELSFQPDLAPLGAGAWSARLRHEGSEDTSLPFYLFVEAPTAPVMTLPQNGGEIEGASTLLSWEPVLGVPYYHVLFSDQEIVIEEDENGDPVISGANLTWQVIVSETSIEYGAPDPSGFFTEMNGTPPPLVPGPVYNWLVLNNYGNNPALSSTRQAGVSAFTVADTCPLDPPLLVAPAAGDTLSDETITFEWSDVPEAAHYHYYLSQIIDDEENQGSVPVYDQVCGQTLLDLPAASILIDSRYQWKVFAIDETGQGVSSEAWEFVYEIATGTLSIHTRDETDEPIPYVDVDLQPLGGGGNPLPIVTGGSGGYDGDFTPGLYRLTASKAGFEDSTLDVEVVEDATTTATLVLAASPATVAGVVRDPSQVPVPFATVFALDETSGEERITQAGAGGDFQIGVTAGDWSLTAGKSGYHAGDPLAVSVGAGEYLELASAVPLIPNSSTLSGAVLSDSGQPVVAATVEATGESETLQQLTASDGLFQFSLAAGDWELTVSKLGFVSPPPRGIALAAGEDHLLDPPLTLSAEAAIVSGFVLAGGGVVAGADITATPEAGAVLGTTSGPAGDYQLSLGPGTWILSANKEGYSPGPPVQLTLSAGDSQEGVELTLSPNPCSVSGQISDGQADIGGATVSNGSVNTQSGPGGSYTLSLPAGAQTLTVWKTGYSGGGPLPGDLAPGQVLTGVDWLLSPDAATVSGRVLSGGQPVPGATVLLDTGSETLVRSSNANGDYSVSTAPGSFLLWAEKEGMAPVDSLSLTLGPGQLLAGQDLGLTPATATVQGTVASDGQPLRDATIRAESVLGSAATSSDLDGDWTLVLPSGASWSLSAEKSGYGDETVQSPFLDTGESWTHDFDLPLLPALLSGHLSDDVGLAVTGATLLFTGAESRSTVTDASGDYELGLQPGNYTLDIAELGYDPHQQGIDVVQGSQTLDVVLTARFASLGGRVLSETDEPLAGVALSASSPTGGGSASSNADGYYFFPRLPADDYELELQKPGYAVLLASVSLAADENAEHDWQLASLGGTLAGSVENATGQPLASVSLQVRDDGQLIAQTLSGADGSFLVEALPDDVPLSLSASMAGYSADSENPLTGLIAPAEGLLFVLAANTGLVQGHVRDAATGAGIDGAEIQVDDGEGFYGQTQSDESGAFLIADLRSTSLYSLSADAPGWIGIELTDITADGASLSLELDAAPASVYGTLFATRGELVPPGSALRGVPLDAGALEVSATIDSTGGFLLEGMTPGAYSLVFVIDGYITEPRSQDVVVAEGASHGPYDFELVSAPLASIAVSGEEQIDNDGSYLYRAAMSVEGGEQVSYPVFWSASPELAGTLDAATGRFTPRSDYIGEVILTARHEASALAGHKTVGVYARLEPDAALELVGGDGMGLDLPAGAVSQSVRITLQRLEPSPVKRRAGAYRVNGDLYHFLPDGLAFSEESQPLLTLPIPGALYKLGLSVGWWDPAGLRWQALGGEKGVDGLAVSLEHFSDYALLVANEPLGVRSAAISPNPFSPYGSAGGAEIRFTVSSQEMDAPLVDVEIFNLLGDPVRSLAHHEPMSVSEEQLLLWNGLTEQGELARNGRYLVRIKVRDNSGDEDHILQAVLIK